MKGLLIKDFQLSLLNTRMLVVLFVISIFLTSSATGSPAFIIGYVTTVFFMFVLTSISYDEMDHSISFLFTLPISRKTYVREKYVFSLLCGLAGLVFSTVICFLLGGLFQNMQLIGPDFLPIALMIYLVLLFLVAIMLPIQLKFGGDNGRIAIFLLFSICAAAVYVGSRILERFNITEPDIIKFITLLLTGNTAPVIAGFVVLILAALGISYRISLGIMEKKAL